MPDGRPLVSLVRPLGGPGAPSKINPRRGQNGAPRGPKWRPEGSWAPALPQVAAQATLRPHVGGSCGPLGGSWSRLEALLAPLGTTQGVPGGYPEARGGAPGGHFGRYS